MGLRAWLLLYPGLPKGHAKKWHKSSSQLLLATQQSSVTIQRLKEKGEILKWTGSEVRPLIEDRLAVSQAWEIRPPR